MCSKRKRIRKGQFPLLDENLYNYLLCVRTNNGEVSTIDLQNKAMEIAKQLGYNDFQASNGYIEGFKTRFNVKFKTLHGYGCDTFVKKFLQKCCFSKKNQCF